MARLHSYTALASEDIYPPRGVLEFNRTFSVARYLADERERTRLRPRLADGQPLTEAAWSKIYDSIPPVSSGQDPFEHFRSVWPRCRELVSAGAWALQPLPQALGAAVDHLVGQIMAGEAECKRVKGSGPKLYGEQRPDLVDRWTDVVCLLAFESIRVNPVFNPSPAAVSDRLIPLFNLLKGIKEASAAWSWAKPPKAEWTEPPQSPTTLRQRLDTAVGGLLPSISQLLQTLALIILVNSPTTTRQEAARMTTPPPNPAIFDRSNSLEPPTTRTQRLRLQWLPSIGREQNNEMPKRTWLLTGLPFVSESLAILHEVISAPGVKSNALRVWLAGAPEGRHDGSAAAWEMADNLVRMYCIGPLAALADLAPELLEEIYGNGIVD